MSKEFNKQEWFEFLKKYKKEEHGKAGATPLQYAKNCEELLYDDLNQLLYDKQMVFSFKPHNDPAALLTLREDGTLPPKYLWKFHALIHYAKEMGRNVSVKKEVVDLSTNYVVTENPATI